MGLISRVSSRTYRCCELYNAKMYRFKIKPENIIVTELSKETATVQDILLNHDGNNYTVSLTKNGQPIGEPSALISSTDVVSGDILWKIPKKIHDLQTFTQKIIHEICLLDNVQSELQQTSKNAIVEFKISGVEVSLTITTKKDNKINCCLTVNDEDTSSFTVGLDTEGLKKVVFDTKSVLSNFLPKPLSGLLVVPNTIVMEIFKYLEFRDLCSLAMVNKRLKSIAETDSLWEQIFHKEYPNASKYSSEKYKKAFERLKKDEAKKKTDDALARAIEEQQRNI